MTPPKAVDAGTRYQVIRAPDGVPVAEYEFYTEAALYALFNMPGARIKAVRVDDAAPTPKQGAM